MKKESICHYYNALLWGFKFNLELCFVLVERNGVWIILVDSVLTLEFLLLSGFTAIILEQLYFPVKQQMEKFFYYF